MGKTFAWEASAKRALLSEKIDLANLEGFWFKARKYSIAAEDAFAALSTGMLDKIPASVRENFSAFLDASGDEEQLAELMKTMPKDEQQQLFNVASFGVSRGEKMRLVLLYGIGESNLGEDQGATIEGATEELVTRIMDMPEVAKELYRHIEEWNRPLAGERPQTSKTQPSGDTKDSASQ